MRCPIDCYELQAEEAGGYQTHRCPQCAGVAISSSLLRPVRAHLALELHKERGDIAVTRACPVDGKPMRPLAYKSVQLHACPSCFELWLAGDQFTELLALVGPQQPVGPPCIGQPLATIPGRGLGNVADGISDILDITADITGVISKLTS